jgi:hypothetical protein
MKIWRAKAASSPTPQVRLEPKDYRDYVATLRRMNAPEKLIKIAEEVADANSAAAAIANR